MKKIFNHTKRPNKGDNSWKNWEDYEEEASYAEDEEYYAEEEGAYTGAGEYYAEEEGAYTEGGEIIYEDDDLYNADYRGEPNRGDRNRERNEGGWLIRKLRETSVMDRVIAGTGVAVLVLALVTGAVLMKSRMAADQVSGFVSVGTQLEDIELIGENGLLAVADAQMARLEAAAMVRDPEETEPPLEGKEPGYEENEYSRQVSVEMNMTSIQRDLKIKFTNEKTGKLVANVPFSVTVTDPDGKSSIWSDDDMDGIIYKKDIAAGTYKVAMEELSDEKYAGYSISTKARTVEVKKDIAYEKVDVANEVKTEAEVDAKKEDTAQKDTVVESVLQDTVAWVESTKVGESYIEVPKSDITDPLTILTAFGGLDKGFLRMTLQSNSAAITAASGPEIKVGSSTQLSAAWDKSQITGNEGETITDVTEMTAASWSSSNTGIVTVDGNGLVTGVAAGEAVVEYTATVNVTYTVTKAVTPEPVDPSVSGGDAEGGETTPGTQTETKTESIPVSGRITIKVIEDSALTKGTITADKTALATVIKGTAVAQITAKAFAKDKKLVYQG
ncbi:MAG: Ig-like domain-containing protein, partial [Acetatifactor sp.]|nr:Ig-like domain-containing protein [Acetatifactor sp.]